MQFREKNWTSAHRLHVGVGGRGSGGELGGFEVRNAIQFTLQERSSLWQWRRRSWREWLGWIQSWGLHWSRGGQGCCGVTEVDEGREEQDPGPLGWPGSLGLSSQWPVQVKHSMLDMLSSGGLLIVK